MSKMKISVFLLRSLNWTVSVPVGLVLALLSLYMVMSIRFHILRTFKTFDRSYGFLLFFASWIFFFLIVGVIGIIFIRITNRIDAYVIKFCPACGKKMGREINRRIEMPGPVSRTFKYLEVTYRCDNCAEIWKKKWTEPEMIFLTKD